MRRLRRCVVLVLTADIDCQIKSQNGVKTRVGPRAGNQLQRRRHSTQFILSKAAQNVLEDDDRKIQNDEDLGNSLG